MKIIKIYMKILHSYTMTFTLITNLTSGFENTMRYFIFEKTYAQISSPPYSRSEKAEIPLNAIAVKICIV